MPACFFIKFSRHALVPLHELLSRHPGARRALIHRGVPECTLRYRDAAAAQALPVDLLRSAPDQLQAIDAPAGRTGLAILRLRLMLAMLRHGDDAAPAPSPGTPAPPVSIGTETVHFRA